MLTDKQQIDLRIMLLDLSKQLDERAKLYRLLNAPEIGDEFERLSSMEVGPMLRIVGAIKS